MMLILHGRCWERYKADAHAVAVLVRVWLAADVHVHDAREPADTASARLCADAHD